MYGPDQPLPLIETLNTDAQTTQRCIPLKHLAALAAIGLVAYMGATTMTWSNLWTTVTLPGVSSVLGVLPRAPSSTVPSPALPAEVQWNAPPAPPSFLEEWDHPQLDKALDTSNAVILDDDVGASDVLGPLLYGWMLLASAWMWWPWRSSGRNYWALLASAATPGDDMDNSEGEKLATNAEEVHYERADLIDTSDPCVISMHSYYGRRQNRWSGLVGNVLDWANSLHPAHVVALINILTTIVLWGLPAFYPLFLVNGLRNPLGFILSGFSCTNPIALVNEVFFYYIVTRPYVSWWTKKEFYTLYLGGTIGGAVLVALQGTAYMGPTAGSAALMAAYMVRNQEHPVAIWPFINMEMPIRSVAIAVGLLNIWFFFDGVASAAAFLGGALFAFAHRQYQLKTRPYGRYRR